VASLSDEHSLLKKFSEFQKRGKERIPQPLIFRKTTTLQNNYQPSSFQVASLSDEHSLLKKFSEFQKRGKRGCSGNAPAFPEVLMPDSL
jgi:hypothetical protein